MSSLTGKVAIVTALSRGIGRSISLRLGRDGAAVTVNYPWFVTLAIPKP
jgi:3-oxoacyl-[acyl-carrier protein] reductase